MRRTFETLGSIACWCGLALGQAAPTAPVFEAADVHVSPDGTTESGGFLPNGRTEFRATTLLRLITLAYSVQADLVVGGPSWLDTDRFDVIAKAASSTSQLAQRTALQGLLAERFNLSIQRQEKPQPVYALVMGKHNPPKESSGSGDPECKTSSEENTRTLTCHKTTLAGLAERLPMVAPGYFNHPVVDRTGLKGAFDFTLQWLPRGQIAPGSEGSSLSIFNSIEKQLGVKVETQTAPMPVLSIEHVSRTPAANPPGVMEKLGPAPTEFEVAEIRPSRPDANQDVTVNAGRLQAQALSLKELIAFGYDVEEDWVKGGEKWLETERFDIVAKTAPTASVDTLRVMLQSLLADRFRLKVHKEQQPVTVYALTVGKRGPTLKDADTSARATCKMIVADGARNYTCQNMTMAQFAEKLPSVAAAYLDHPVVDLTGLKGAYDFVVTWAPRARAMGVRITGAGDGGQTGTTPAASDPPVGLTVFEAVDRQLGLKLASQKHPMSVIVIDHVDRKPAEN